MSDKLLLQDTMKQPGKCPMTIRISEDEKGTVWKVYIPEDKNLPDSDKKRLDTLIQKLTATQDSELADEIYKRALFAMPVSEGAEHNVNAVFQALADFEPQDPTEAKLYLQSTVLYAQGMQYLQKAERSEILCQSEFYMKSALKLLRLHNETIEAISRYRRKGEQKVIVQHVNVENGGKAIVGNMIADGGGR